ncbi:hypothetical protein NC652_021982 [Populus alba x Populus x berolinensis]|nr:hypothetical protein NC652_021982 [Populus alba x Populus x berolinensis]
MGEPLQNINSVLKAANITVHDQGLHFSPRKVTVSTSGLVPQLKHFLHESNCALAVTTALREEPRLKNIYKVLFEYVMLEGVNDRLDRPLFFCILFHGILLFCFLSFFCSIIQGFLHATL